MMFRTRAIPMAQSKSSLLDAAEEGHARGSEGDDNGEDGDVLWLNITVSDTGTGIHPDRLSNIFEPYSQAKLSDYRKHGGTGLGLSINSGLTTAMGGTIAATSELDKGSKFVVRLPIQVLSGEHPPREKSVSESTSSSSSSSVSNIISNDRLLPVPSSVDCLSPTNQMEASPLPSLRLKSPTQNCFSFPPNDYAVLVVDDNLINQKILSLMLAHFGLDHCPAGNGQEAVDTVLLHSRNANPDRLDLPLFHLIFMDLSMPVKDGYEAIAELRANNVQVPIIALTANALSQERIRATEAGATDFHTKPILRNSLLEVCRRYLVEDSQRAASSSGQ
jgi:CheY-like chemotaxis protein